MKNLKPAFLFCGVIAIAIFRLPSGVAADSYDTIIREPLREYVKKEDLPKHALVVGIEKYEKLKPATNASNDARLMHRALAELGFKVEGINDGPTPEITREKLLSSIEDFKNRILASNPSQPKIVVFYFAGHGFNHLNGNFLVTSNAPLDSQRLLDHGISLDHIVAELGPGNAILLLFLDACRTEFSFIDGNKPFLKPIPINFRDVFYGYASTWGYPAYGKVNESDTNSPFSRALDTNIRKRLKEVKTMFGELSDEVSVKTDGKQIPSYDPNFAGQFFFVPSEDQDKLLLGELSAAILIGGPPCVEKFLRQHPTSPYSNAARKFMQRFPNSDKRLCLESANPRVRSTT